MCTTIVDLPTSILASWFAALMFTGIHNYFLLLTMVYVIDFVMVTGNNINLKSFESGYGKHGMFLVYSNNIFTGFCLPVFIRFERITRSY